MTAQFVKNFLCLRCITWRYKKVHRRMLERRTYIYIGTPSQSLVVKDFVVFKKILSSAQSHIERAGCLRFTLLRSKLSPPFAS